MERGSSDLNWVGDHEEAHLNRERDLPLLVFRDLRAPSIEMQIWEDMGFLMGPHVLPGAAHLLALSPRTWFPLPRSLLMSF